MKLRITLFTMMLCLVICLCACGTTQGKDQEVSVISMELLDPLPRECMVGETLSLDGIQVNVKYSNNTFEKLQMTKEDYTLDCDTSKPGAVDASATLYGTTLTVSFTVNVVPPTKPVAVTGGQIVGYKNNSGVNVYKGIPYAAAPVGENRWKRPQDLVSWDGILACQHWGDSAVQGNQQAGAVYTEEFIISNKNLSEDCLTLNVWTAEDGADQRPVLVYIHGGGYTGGGSSCEIYEGDYIAAQGAVFVSINYRLGIMGFLATNELIAEDPEAAGNYGVLDMIKALEWVRDNISTFGGDPDCVTIVGQSAGGAAVLALMSTEQSAGLFHRAVSMSYGFGELGTQAERAAEASEKALFGEKSLAELREMSWEDIRKAGYNPSGPVIDNSLFSCSYIDAVRKGITPDIPYMTGNVYGDENGDMTDLAAKGLEYGLRSESGMESPTFVYYFTHETKGPSSTTTGCYHTYDVPYWLHVFSSVRSQYWTENDFSVSEKMAAYLLNFARTGDPNGDGLAKWEPSAGNFVYLLLDDSFSACVNTSAEIEAAKDRYPNMIR